LEDTEAEPEVPNPKKKKIVKRTVKRPKKTKEGSHGQSHYTSSGKATKQVETLSTLASTCSIFVVDITTQGQESDPFTALKEKGNVRVRVSHHFNYNI
jgi:hypothetical protein